MVPGPAATLQGGPGNTATENPGNSDEVQRTVPVCVRRGESTLPRSSLSFALGIRTWGNVSV